MKKIKNMLAVMLTTIMDATRIQLFVAKIIDKF